MTVPKNCHPTDLLSSSNALLLCESTSPSNSNDEESPVDFCIARRVLECNSKMIGALEGTLSFANHIGDPLINSNTLNNANVNSVLSNSWSSNSTTKVVGSPLHENFQWKFGKDRRLTLVDRIAINPTGLLHPDFAENDRTSHLSSLTQPLLHIDAGMQDP